MNSWKFDSGPLRRPAPGESIDDYRARRAADQLLLEQRRREDLAAQCALDSTADARIRAWEKAHQLRLPSKLSHPVLRVIAAATGLPLEIVEAEQLRRKTAVRATPATTP